MKHLLASMLLLATFVGAQVGTYSSGGGPPGVPPTPGTYGAVVAGPVTSHTFVFIDLKDDGSVCTLVSTLTGSSPTDPNCFTLIGTYTCSDDASVIEVVGSVKIIPGFPNKLVYSINDGGNFTGSGTLSQY